MTRSGGGGRKPTAKRGARPRRDKEPGGLAPGGAETDARASTGGAPDPLVIRHLEFLGGMASAGGWRPDNRLPEVAFAGRSNVGKSSLLNQLVRRKAFARVSRTPGRTREINFFAVNREFVLVDLPGYGYARVSKAQKQEWRPLMERYLKHTRQLRGVVLLIDARREPTDDDLAMLDFLAEVEVPVLIAVTKIDKLPRREVGPRLASLATRLAVEESQLIPFSAHTGEGRDELAEAVAELVALSPDGHDDADDGDADGDVSSGEEREAMDHRGGEAAEER